MLIEVTDRCSGHGRCYSVAPQVFEADDEGYVIAVGRTIEVPAEQEEAARLAVDTCPEGALVIVHDRPS